VNKRKWWALLLALILVVGVIPIQSVFAATTATLGIKADKKAANPGDTINFTVEIEQTGGISGWEFLVELPDGLSLVDSSLQAGELENLSAYLDKQTDGSIKGTGCINTGICGEGETSTHTLATFSATVDEDAEFQNYTVEFNTGCFVADHTGTGYAAISTYACSVAVGPTIVVSDVKAGPGENAYVTISLTDNPGIASMMLDMTFDTDVLTLVEVNDAGVLGDTSHKPEKVNPYTLAWVNDEATEDFTVTGTIVTLVFKVADDAEMGDVTPIEISYDYDQYDIMNADSQKVKFAIANGSVTVAQTGPNAIGDFEYTTSGTEMTITGYIGASKEVEIGSTYTVGDVEYTVTAIADDAFADNNSIISVIIPETVTTIGAGAFYNCLSLTEVTVLSENATIGEVALGYYYISRTQDGIIEGFTIKGYEGSTAETYAAAVEDITFVALPKPCKHSGGEATCKDLAVCENCGESYGELDPSNHKGDTYVEGQKETSCYEEGYTGDTYCSDCDVKIADGESIPVSSHNPASVWSTDATHHWKECQTVGCGNLIDKAEHTGGEATCTKQAICTVCQIPYGNLDGNNHKNTEIRGAVEETCNESGYTGDTWCKDCETKIADGKTIDPTGNHIDVDGQWESNGTQHFHTCECGTEFDHTNHAGGEATCKEQAVCSVCETAYGELNPSNHKGDTYLVGQKETSCYEEGYTGDTYCSDCDVKIADGENIPMSSHNPASVWSTDETYHWKDCQTVGCGNLIDKAEHTGGEATCTKQAICSVCQVAYGDLDSSNHKNTEVRNAVKETCNESGYTGDTWCKDCETKIADGKTIEPTGDHVDADDEWESNETQHFHTCGCETEFDHTNHAGGEATCKEQAVCSVCETAYGELNASNHKGDTYLVGQKETSCYEEGYTGDTYCSDCDVKIADGESIPESSHNPASVWSTDETHHWKDCQTVGCGNLINKAEHTGGEATCTKQAICSVCQIPYGNLDGNNHKNTEIRDAVKETCNESGYTGDTWCKDCETKIADGKTIDPTGDHVDADDKWESNGTQHFHTCGCGTEFDHANHAGGEATCKAQAVCSTCQTSYGETNPSNHKGDTHLVGDKKATCKEEGYTGDTYCSDCDTKLSDGKSIDKVPHIVNEWTISEEATVDKTGKKTGTCVECQDTLTVTTAQLVSEIKKVEGVQAEVEAVGDTNISADVVFVAQEVQNTLDATEKKDIENAIKTSISSEQNFKFAAIFDLKLMLREISDGDQVPIAETELELNGTVKVTIPVPTDVLEKLTDVKLVHIKDNGEAELIPFSLANGKATFEAKEFSYYTFIGTEKASTNDSTVGNNNTNSPQTGDAVNMFFWIALLFVSGTCFTAYVVFKKRTK